MFGLWRKKDQGSGLTASDALMDAHVRLVAGFRRDDRYKGFDGYAGIEVANLSQLAGVVYRHFDVHFYKALDAITRYEAVNLGPFTSILRQEQITVVDLGAGIGTEHASRVRDNRNEQSAKFPALGLCFQSDAPARSRSKRGVATNACGLIRAAVELAAANGVRLMAREELASLLAAHPMSLAEILSA